MDMFSPNSAEAVPCCATLPAGFVLDEQTPIAELRLHFHDPRPRHSKVAREMSLRAPRDTVLPDVVEKCEEDERLDLCESEITDAAAEQPPRSEAGHTITPALRATTP